MTEEYFDVERPLAITPIGGTRPSARATAMTYEQEPDGLATRLASERAFHNRRFREGGDHRSNELKYYWAIQRGAQRFARSSVGINPFINAYRCLTPSARTRDEHPLKPRDFKVFRRHFSKVELEFFGLLSLAAIPLRAYNPGQLLRRALEELDEVFLSIPGLRFLAWYALINFAK